MDAPVSSADVPGTVTISVTVLRGEPGAALDAARAEVARAVQVNHGTLLESSADQVRAAYGTRRPTRDHALRAIRGACDQVEFLRGSGAPISFSIGLAMPPAEGDDAPDAARLAALAPAETVLVTEPVFRAALAQLPANWEAAPLAGPPSAKSPPDLEFAEPAHLLIGPNVASAPELATFRFSCVGRLSSGPAVFAVDRPERADDLAARDLYASPQLKRLGAYQLTALIGRGATAEVWRAHTDGGEVVAIKRLRDSATASEQHRRRFEREAAILSRLDHPNICRVREMQATEEDRYIVMDFIEGATLAEVLTALTCGDSSVEARLGFGVDLAVLVNCVEKSRSEALSRLDDPPTTARSRLATGTGTLPVAQALAVMQKIALAVEHAHHLGILHRDLKPANILIRPDGEPVVTDFGLAKLSTPHDSSISLADQILGTLEYMAPEQARSSREVDERADVYALGAILYELLTGRRAFIGSGHLLNDAERLQTHHPIPPREIDSQLDVELELVVLQALRQRPLERYASAGDFLADLERYTRGEAVHAQPASLRARAAAVASALRRRFS